jgi:hypothetical protein
VEAQVTVKPHRIKPAHLMCGQPVWGIAGALACFYFAYLSLVHIRRNDFAWVHDGWSIVTYGIWVLLMAGLLFEPRCWRERIFFALLLANFALGFALAVWADVPVPTVREARAISGAAWMLAALVSLTITFSSAEGAKAG